MSVDASAQVGRAPCAVVLEAGDRAGEVALAEHEPLVDAVDDERRVAHRAPRDVLVVGVVTREVLTARPRGLNTSQVPVVPDVPPDHLLRPRDVADLGRLDRLVR